MGRERNRINENTGSRFGQNKSDYLWVGEKIIVKAIAFYSFNRGACRGILKKIRDKLFATRSSKPNYVLIYLIYND